MMAAVRGALFLVFASCGDAIRPLHYASTAQGSSELRENSLGPRFKALSKSSRRSPCRRSAWIFFPLTMLRSKDRIIRAAKITGIAWIVRIIWIAKITRNCQDRRWTSCSRRDRQKVLPEYRKSCRNTESLAGIQKVLLEYRRSRRDASTAS